LQELERRQNVGIISWPLHLCPVKQHTLSLQWHPAGGFWTASRVIVAILLGVLRRPS
jgi:hypothetical protein